MRLFKSKEQKEIEKLIKDRNKHDKRINKEMEKRMQVKYTSKFLEENKKHLTENAMTIDELEYKQIVEEFKKRFPDIKD